MPEENVDGSNRTGRRNVQRLQQLVLGHCFAHRLEIRAGDHHKTFWIENAVKFPQRDRHFMRKNMFDIVGRIQRVHAAGGDQAHVRHRAGDVGFHRRIDIEPDFLPLLAVESFLDIRFRLRAASHVQESFHYGNRGSALPCREFSGGVSRHNPICHFGRDETADSFNDKQWRTGDCCRTEDDRRKYDEVR